MDVVRAVGEEKPVPKIRRFHCRGVQAVTIHSLALQAAGLQRPGSAMPAWVPIRFE